MKIPNGSASASYTDNDGYTITIVAYDVPFEMNNSDNITIDHDNLGRAGRFYITSPKGRTVFSGYWMDFPEKGWKHKGVDLWKDYERWIRRGKWWKAAW